MAKYCTSCGKEIAEDVFVFHSKKELEGISEQLKNGGAQSLPLK